MKIFFILSITGLCLIQALAQNAKVDSLNQLISKATSDTARINLTIKKMQLLSNVNLDSAIYVGEKTLAEAKKINYYRGIVDVVQNLIGNYCFKGNYKAADENLKFLTQFIKPSKDSADISKVYSNYGMMYGMQSKYDTSIQFYEKAIRIAERNHDSSSLKKNYRNIAIGYEQQSNFPPAIAYLQKSLAISELQNDEVNQAYIYLNLGNTYHNMYDTVRVEPAYLKAVALAKKNNLKNVELYAYTNLASFYVRREEWNKAHDYAMKSAALGAAMGDQGIAAASFSKAATALANTNKFNEAQKLDRRAIALADSSGQPLNIYQAYATMGTILKMQEKYKEAIPYFERGFLAIKNLDLYNEATSKDWESLSECYEKTGNHVEALDAFKKAASIRDSVRNEDNVRKATELTMNYEFDKKQAAAKAEQEKKDAVAEAILQKQKSVKNISLGALGVVGLFLMVVFFQKNSISKEKKRSDELLLNILPAETAEELKATGSARAKNFDRVTVMFTDFKDFTQASEKMSAEDLVREINYCYSAFDKIISKYRIEKIKTIGDAYMCAGGLPVKNVTNPEDVIRAGIDIRDFILNRKKEREEKGEVPFEIRIGIHTGPVVAGIVGIKKFAYDIWGDTVNIASRMEESSEPGKVNISEATYELVRHYFHCVYRGKIVAKNKREMDMYFAEE